MYVEPSRRFRRVQWLVRIRYRRFDGESSESRRWRMIFEGQVTEADVWRRNRGRGWIDRRRRVASLILFLVEMIG